MKKQPVNLNISLIDQKTKKKIQKWKITMELHKKSLKMVLKIITQKPTSRGYYTKNGI